MIRWLSKSLSVLARRSRLSSRGTPASLTCVRHYETNLSKFDQQLYEMRSKEVSEKLVHYYPIISSTRAGQTQDGSGSGGPTAPSLLRVPEFIKSYSGLLNEEKRTGAVHIVEGKVTKIRKSSKKLVFVDVTQDFAKIQLVYSLNTINEFNKSTQEKDEKLLSKEQFLESYDFLRVGDSVSVTGYPFRTKSGELSLRSTKSIRILSPSLVPANREIDPDRKFSNYKVSNYLADKSHLAPLIIRQLIVNSMRGFLINQQQFIEVETPIISNTANGANANPFITSSPHLKQSEHSDDKKPAGLSLRIAPELFLKKLIISGFDKIFEIGRVFRNEGIDAIHNPEFTTCEFYQSYTDLNQLIQITEDMLMTILEEVRSYIISNKSNVVFVSISDEVLANINGIIADFKSQEQQSQLKKSDYPSTGIQSRYFQVLEFIPTVERQTRHTLPSDLSDLDALKQFFAATGTELPSVISVPNLLNKLASDHIEPLCAQPTLIAHHPVQSSPLSKSSVKLYSADRAYEVAHRFELFIASQEYINAYEEENSPVAQACKFASQFAFKESSNDAEISMLPDLNFVKAMEYGMPPTGGWGCGIDRLAMLVSGRKKIDEVLSFGNLKDVIRY